MHIVFGMLPTCQHLSWRLRHPNTNQTPEEVLGHPKHSWSKKSTTLQFLECYMEQESFWLNCHDIWLNCQGPGREEHGERPRRSRGQLHWMDLHFNMLTPEMQDMLIPPVSNDQTFQQQNHLVYVFSLVYGMFNVDPRTSTASLRDTTGWYPY